MLTPEEVATRNAEVEGRLLTLTTEELDLLCQNVTTVIETSGNAVLELAVTAIQHAHRTQTSPRDVIMAVMRGKSTEALMQVIEQLTLMQTLLEDALHNYQQMALIRATGQEACPCPTCQPK